jgi:hypothetical protein
MSHKKATKKLRLTRESLRKLTTKQLGNANGGALWSQKYSCLCDGWTRISTCCY